MTTVANASWHLIELVHMARASTLNVSLTPKQRQFVDRRVASGRYESASEVVREGLRALEERDRIAAEYWADVRAKVAEARSSVARSGSLDGPSAMAALRTRLEAQGALPRTRIRKRAS
jgi:antitoxin ParD1/3/4